jgi:RHS repeat-associated protein
MQRQYPLCPPESTALMTATNGTAVGGSSYEPFVDEQAASGELPAQRFTGQRLDDTGLYFYNARYYDATLGRFISADTVVSDPVNPQALTGILTV